LEEKGVAQGSMDAHGHQPSTEILSEEVFVVEVEQVMASATQVEAGYNSNNDLLETEQLTTNPIGSN
jgi:hypothetical protein